MTKTWLSLLALTAGLSARAEVLVKPAFSYSIDKTEQSSTSTTTRRLIDLDAGYLTADGWALLGSYATENIKSESGGSSSIVERSGFGAGGGYYSKAGPYIDAIYFIQAKQEGSGNTLEGNGWKVDLGWKFDLSKVGIGLQLTYRTYNYTKSNGQSMAVAYKKTNLDPMFAFLFVF